MITINRSLEYRWCNHAVSRWIERFADIDKSCDFSTARLASKKQKTIIKQLTPINAKRYMNDFRGRYFMVSKAGIVYVVSAKGANKAHDIVTVFSLKDKNT